MNDEKLTLSEVKKSLHIADKLRMLSPREQAILKWRCGIDEEKPLTLDEIGKKFDVNRETIRQVEIKALQKLHHLIS